MFNGAIGMTYEQAGGGGAGLGIQTAVGDTLSLLDRLTHHTTTGLSTVEMASEHQKRVTTEFGSYFERAISDPPGEFESYVIRASSAGSRLEELIAHLDKLGIRYGAAAKAGRVSGMDYRTSATGKQNIAAGDLVIPASQPRAVMTRVLFDPEVVMSDSLTYDITGWALPYAYDLDAVASTEAVAYGDWTATTETSENHSDNPYAYVFAWDDAGDASFLSALLRKKFVVRYNLKEFSIHGKTFAPGSLIVTRRNNERFGSSFSSDLASLAKKYGQTSTGLATGFVDAGFDLGSNDVRFIKPPRVAIPFGSPIGSYGVGEVWHMFDNVFEYPVTRFSADNFSSLDLEDYDVIVLPSTSYSKSGVRQQMSWLNEQQLGRLTSWIRSGGKLIAMGGVSSWFSGKSGFSISDKEAEKTADSTATATARRKRYEDRNRDRAPDSNPGAIYRVSVDNSHPLGFGFSDYSFVLRRRSDHPEIMTGSSDWNVGIIEEGGRVSGHTGYKAEKRTEGSLSFGAQSMQSGSVVYLMDDPLFRGFWRSGHMLFANAVFMVGQ